MQRNVSGRVFVIKQGLSRAGLDSENRLGLIYLWETWKESSKNSALLNTQSQKIATRRVAVIAMLSSPRCCAEDSLKATIEAFLPPIHKVQARCCNQTKKVLISDALSHTWMVQLIQPRPPAVSGIDAARFSQVPPLQLTCCPESQWLILTFPIFPMGFTVHVYRKTCLVGVISYWHSERFCGTRQPLSEQRRMDTWPRSDLKPCYAWTRKLT